MALLSPEPPAHSTTVKLSIMFPPKADPQSVHPQVPVVLRLLHFTHVALTSGAAGMDYSLYLDPHPRTGPVIPNLFKNLPLLPCKDQGWQRLIFLCTTPSVSSSGYGFHPCLAPHFP